MRYPKLREIKEAIKALIKGPYTSRFPYEPHKPFERFRGKPEFHKDDCIGCTACVNVCPSNALSFEDKIENNKAKRILIYQLDLCIFCGQCQANCPTGKGIILSQEFDLATTENREDLKQEIEKELLLCDGCGEIIAPYEQILWVAKKLGPLTFSNASLMLIYLQNFPAIAGSRPILDAKRENLALREKPSPKEEELEFMRSDRIKILCPRCKREAVLKS
jgi:formate hydrogenlyase subunit 6/NADH:ubiquinone oxidoreductase subunit I